MDIKTFCHNFKGHLTTINAHKIAVMKHCFKVGLYKQGLLHDLSKYSPIEFIPGVPTMHNVRLKASHLHGFTTKDATGTTTNIG